MMVQRCLDDGTATVVLEMANESREILGIGWSGLETSLLGAVDTGGSASLVADG